ncbi:MAG: hypothetical protein MUP22_06730, partial [Desulfobacterales bacterium]|nr:hypothetical protein [Desulfobacterales bacterium]
MSGTNGGVKKRFYDKSRIKPMMELELVKRVGISAALKGAKILRSYFGNVENISKKGAIDLVTEADLNSEKAIIETIRNAFPDHSILAEESGL